MGRVITTRTNLSSYVGNTIRISGSDCCWEVIGTVDTPDTNVRDVEVLLVGCYYYDVGVLAVNEPIIVQVF